MKNKTIIEFYTNCIYIFVLFKTHHSLLHFYIADVENVRSRLEQKKRSKNMRIERDKKKRTSQLFMKPLKRIFFSFFSE